MMLSVIIPAYNEEKYLPQTLAGIREALLLLASPSEIVVVDNESEDETKAIAESFRARVVWEKEHNISRVRNTGARNSEGDVFIFVDADTLVPEELLREIMTVMQDERCFGGAVSVGYESFKRRWVKIYLLGWKFWEKVFNTKQGATQFCRREAFAELKGYDESMYMGEDVEFYWRLSKLAKRREGFVSFIAHLKVTTSSRRFDKMSWWKTILLTHPFFIRLAWKRKRFWKDWYENAAR